MANVVTIARERYNDETEHRRQWGGGKLGPKARARIAKQKRLIAKVLSLSLLFLPFPHSFDHSGANCALQEEKLRQKAAAR